MSLLNAMIGLICGRPLPVAEPAPPRWQPDTSWTAFLFAHPSAHASMRGKTAIWLMRDGWEQPFLTDLRQIPPELNAHGLYWKPVEVAMQHGGIVDAEWSDAAPVGMLPRS